MAGDDPAAQAGVAAGQQASALGAQQILKAQTGEPPVAERSWADRTMASYRNGAGVCLYPAFYATIARTFASGQLLGAYFAPDSEQRQAVKTISAIDIICNNVGSAVTLAQLGIWDYATNALLASTADFSGSLSLTVLARPLTTPIPMPTKPFWVCMVVAFTTTSPQIAATTVIGSVGPPAHTPLVSCTQTGLAALPNPLVPVANASVPWFGLS